MSRVVLLLVYSMGTITLAAGPKLVCQDIIMENVYAKQYKTLKIEVTNSGTKDLVINKVKTSCGCTVPAQKVYLIEPRKSGTVIIGYTPQKLKGAYHHRILLMSNDPEQPKKIVTLEGNILRSDYKISTSELLLHKIIGGEVEPSESIAISSAHKVEL